MRYYDDAILYYKKSLKIKLSIFGDNHLETGLLYNNIGIYYKSKLIFFKSIIQLFFYEI
jgi:hypothetical protein